MKTKPLRWIVISAFGLTAGWLCVKPAVPHKRVRSQRLHTVNSLYMVSAAAPSTNASQRPLIK